MPEEPVALGKAIGFFDTLDMGVNLEEVSFAHSSVEIIEKYEESVELKSSIQE